MRKPWLAIALATGEMACAVGDPAQHAATLGPGTDPTEDAGNTGEPPRMTTSGVDGQDDEHGDTASTAAATTTLDDDTMGNFEPRPDLGPCDLCTTSDTGDDAMPQSCADWLARDPNAASGTHMIDLDGVGGEDPFSVYCDMTTAGGGWTVLFASDGGDGNVALVSNVVVEGNPLFFEHYNLDTARKVALSEAASESLVRRPGPSWLQMDTPLFTGALAIADSHEHMPVTITAADGSTANGWIGFANFNIDSGGDFYITQEDGDTCSGSTVMGVDHHSTAYYHLNCGCMRHYLYSYSSVEPDGDASYKVNTPLGTWGATQECDGSEGGGIMFYAAVR